MSWHFSKYHTSCCIVLCLTLRTALGCLQNSNGRITSLELPLESRIARNQAIVTSYSFQCCGNITEWIAYVRLDDNNDDESHYTIKFQVWRPSVTASGCYIMVGEDTLNDTQELQEIQNEVYRITVPSSNTSVQPLDVIGYTIFDNRREIFKRSDGVVLDTASRNESVWYSVEKDGMNEVEATSCLNLTGSNGARNRFTNAAPLISVGIATSACQESLGSNLSTIPLVLPSPTATHSFFTQTTIPTPSSLPSLSTANSPPSSLSTLSTANSPPSSLSTLSTANSLPAGGIGGVVLAVCGFVFLMVIGATLVTFAAIKKKKSTRAGKEETKLNSQRSEGAAYVDVSNVVSELCEPTVRTLSSEPVYEEVTAPVPIFTEITIKTNQAYGCLPGKTESLTASGTENPVEVENTRSLKSGRGRTPVYPTAASKKQLRNDSYTKSLSASYQEVDIQANCILNKSLHKTMQCVALQTAKEDSVHLYATPSEENNYINC